MSNNLARSGPTRQLGNAKAPSARRVAGHLRLLAMGVVAALTFAIAGCSSGNQEAPSAGGNAEVGKTNDINPQDPATLQKGGNLRLALTEFPANFNSQQIDGNTGDVGTIMRPTMPRAFRIGPDGSMT